MSFMAVLIASLLGSGHCAGMCGGVVLAYSGLTRRPHLAHVSYHFGRLTTYALLGLLGGLVGERANLLIQPAGIQSIAALVMGIALILWGSVMLFSPASFLLHGVRALALKLGSVLGGPLRWCMRGKGQHCSVELRALLLGLCTAFLPCGWLYSFVAVAVASADPLWGVGIMTAFWLGTLPILTSLGLLAQFATAKFRALLPRISAALMLLAGVAALLGHVYSFPFSAHSHARLQENGAGQVLCIP